MANNDLNIKKIDARDWNDVKEKWLAYIPSISVPGDAPTNEVKDFHALSQVYTKTAALRGEPYFEEIQTLRSEILKEGIYLIHKAIHVNGCSIIQLENGNNSWSLSSSYQSSFFALKGILSCLGLSFPRLTNYLMIDCFPKGEELSRSQIKKGRIPKTELKFVVFKDLSHVEQWEIFQRVLRMTSIDLWDSDVVDYLKNIDPTSFVTERNDLHYVNNYWTYPKDLYTPNIDPAFGVNYDLTTNFTSFISSSGNQHPLYITYSLIRMAVALIKDIGTLSSVVDDEYKLMTKTLYAGMHSRFLDSIDKTLL